MDKRIEKYFYEELSPEERLSLLHDVEANEEAICGISEYVRFIESGASDGKQGGRQR